MRFKSNPKNNCNSKAILSDSDGDVEKFYQVKQILDCRTNSDGSLEYLVKWDGYTSEDNSWEPSSGLYCPQALQNFETERKQIKNGFTDNETNSKVKKRICVGKKTNKSIKNECVETKSIFKKQTRREKRNNSVQLNLKDHYIMEEEGIVPDVILGVDRYQAPENGRGTMMALMTYTDGRMEFVPTGILRKYNEAASMLIDFYEQRVHLS